MKSDLLKRMKDYNEALLMQANTRSEELDKQIIAEKDEEKKAKMRLAKKRIIDAIVQLKENKKSLNSII